MNSWNDFVQGNDVKFYMRGEDGEKILIGSGQSISGSGEIHMLGDGPAVDLPDASFTVSVAWKMSAGALKRYRLEHYVLTRIHYANHKKRRIRKKWLRRLEKMQAKIETLPYS